MYCSIEKKITDRTVYLVVFYISAIIMTSITFYALYQSTVEYAATGKIIIGEILVKTEFPFKGLSKLITYLIIKTSITFYALYQSTVEYAATGKIIIGEILVKTEFPFKGLSKLITYLMI